MYNGVNYLTQPFAWYNPMMKIANLWKSAILKIAWDSADDGFLQFLSVDGMAYDFAFTISLSSPQFVDEFQKSHSIR